MKSNQPYELSGKDWSPSIWSSSFTLLSQSKKPGTKTSVFLKKKNINNWWWTGGRVVRGERCQKLARNWETASTNNSNNCSLWQQYRLLRHCSVLVNKRIKRFKEIFHSFLVLGSWFLVGWLLVVCWLVGWWLVGWLVVGWLAVGQLVGVGWLADAG